MGDPAQCCQPLEIERDGNDESIAAHDVARQRIALCLDAPVCVEEVDASFPDMELGHMMATPSPRFPLYHVAQVPDAAFSARVPHREAKETIKLFESLGLVHDPSAEI